MTISIIIPVTLLIQYIGLPVPLVNAIYNSNENNQNYKRLEKDNETTSEYKEWIIPVTLYDSLGPPSSIFYNNIDTRTNIQPTSTKKSLPPRYSIGAISIPNKNDVESNDHDDDHLFTFDLGNPGQTIFLTEECKGCYSDLEPKSGCPKMVPMCNEDDNLNIDTDTDTDTDTATDTSNHFCWPSHPHQYLPIQSFRFVTKQFCPYKDGHGDTYAGDLDNVPVCIACFDGGDHSRFYSFAEMDFSFVDAVVTNVIRDNDANPKEIPSLLRSYYRTNKNEPRKDNDKYLYVSKPAPIIEKYQFGALVRTVPLKDRIWSNIGIGANSSFMNQLPAYSFMFDFDYYNVKKNNDNIVTADHKDILESTITHHKERIIFNPNPNRYQTWDKSPYVIHHHRHHIIQRFCFGNTKCLSFHEKMEIPSNIDFFMDTGNDGVSISDRGLQNYLANQSGGMWMKDQSDPNNYGVGRLFVPYSKEEAPEMTIIMEPGITITLPAYAWVFDQMQMGEYIRFYQDDKKKDNQKLSKQEGMYPTIFVTDKQNILGLPFLSAPGYSFVFEDLELMLYIHKQTLEITSYQSLI